MIRKALYCTLLTGIALALSAAPSLHAQATPAPRLVTMAVNNGDRVALKGSIRKGLQAATDLGPANPSLPAHHVMLVLQRADDRQAALDQYLRDVQNRQSSEFNHWLTPAQYGTRFGASADDIQSIVSWLQSQGLTIERTLTAANVIAFSGTVGQLQNAFSTSIHSVSVNGEHHLTNMTEAQLPQALAPAIKGLIGLDDFHPRSHIHEGPTAVFNPTTKRIEPDFTLYDSSGNSYLYLDPSDAATVYNTPNAKLNPGYSGTTYDGTGVTVGVVGDSNVDMEPITNYRLAFLGETSSNVNLPNVIIDGSDPGINGDEVEAFLDLEVLGGIAPKAKINYYASNDSDLSAGLFSAIERAVNDNTVSILSISYGGCEASLGSSTNAFISEVYQQAAAQGITVVVSSGDSGAAGCDSSSATTATQGLAVSGLSTTPYNIAVGGTDFDVLASSFTTYVNASSNGVAPYWRTALQYIPERPWNDSTNTNDTLSSNTPYGSTTNIIGGGGGKSTVYAKPTFQSGLTPSDSARDVPDVSFLAGNGSYGAVWVICESSLLYGPNCATSNGAFTSSARFSGAGGTSAATPAFAGMLALVVQSTGTRLGQANNVLYKLAATKYSTVFHDVTEGNISVVCSKGTNDCGSNGFTTGYDATTGYDLASGLGSVNAAAMLANWSSGTGTGSTTTFSINGTSSPLTATHGSSLNLSVNVNPSTATGSAALVNTATAAAGTPTLNGQPFVLDIKNGIGTGTYNGLPGGQYTVYASYSGDANIAASKSTPISVDISPEAGSTLLFVNAYTPAQAALTNLNALPYGSYVYVETSVYGTAEGYTNSLGSATGTMTILDNGASIGTSPITSSNLSSFPSVAAGVYPFAVGTHKLTATFPGDASYKANTSNEVDITVLKGATSASVSPTSSTLYSTSSDNVEVDIMTSSLGKAPTGTITLEANGTTLGSSSSLLNGTRNNGTVLSYFIFNVPGTQLADGLNTLTATYSGDSNYADSTATGTLTVSHASFSLKSDAINMNAGSTAGNTATISATPSGGFAGVVNLSCAVTSTPASATSPVTCSVPSTINVTGTGIASSTLTVNSTAATTAGAYVVTITGKDATTGTLTASTASAVTVTPAVGITLSNSTPITITAGAVSGNTSTLTVAPTGGFTGVVSLSCAITSAPANAINPVTCLLSPTTVTISGSTIATSVLTVNSTARTTGTLTASHNSHNLLRGLSEPFLAIGIFFLLPKRRRRQFITLAVVAVVLLGSFVGCGGGSKGGTSSPGQSGTTSGTYVVTVTANPAGGTAQISTVNVTVN
jgi:subtilase family serine protease